jgi:glutathione synthase/RimK-type ligase-like ATP-grasp enzyme
LLENIEMNVVFLSPHFPPHFHHFCRNLRQLGATVLGIADVPWEALAPALQAALSDYYRVPDLHDDDALLRACGWFTHRHGKIDRLDSLSEYWLATEARLRENFNIFGLRPADIAHVRHKSGMKARFRAAGVPVAEGGLIPDLASARELAARTGYPMIAKPDAGVGALDTFKLENDAELERFFASPPPVPYLAEAFIDGTIHSFDGLTDRNGRIVFHTAHRYSQGIMETVNEGRHIAYYSLREIPPALEAMGRACVESFAVRERFFHIEFFETAPGQFVALEVNLRPPGGYTTDMFNFANDIDIYRAWAELLVRNRTELAADRRYHCCYASRKHHLRYRHSHADILTRYGGQMLMVETVPGVFSSALGDIGYIFRSPQLAVIEEIIAFIHAIEF